jgi:hypothetical protein
MRIYVQIDTGNHVQKCAIRNLVKSVYSILCWKSRKRDDAEFQPERTSSENIIQILRLRRCGDLWSFNAGPGMTWCDRD